MTKYIISLAVCAMIVLNLSGVSQAADTTKAATPPAPAKVEAPKTPAATHGSVLALEKKNLAESSAVMKDLKGKKFRKRMPQNYKQIKLTEEQEKKVYAIQQDYFETVSALEGRLLRLRQERDTEIEAVLTAEQKSQLTKLQPVKTPKAPKKPRAKKEAK
ncbi:MAG: hypothetical protein PHQ75_11000 [Thermoguttaceae bacterium]|nr:hypothetical protein [Thermoguttaceae bacterium]